MIITDYRAIWKARKSLEAIGEPPKTGLRCPEHGHCRILCQHHSGGIYAAAPANCRLRDLAKEPQE